jgi:hypothetical protein
VSVRGGSVNAAKSSSLSSNSSMLLAFTSIGWLGASARACAKQKPEPQDARLLRACRLRL